MFLRLLHVVACVSTSIIFFFNYLFIAQDYTLHDCTTFYLSIHQLVDIWVVFNFRLWWVMLLWILFKSFCVDTVIHFFWEYTYVWSCLCMLRTAKLFSTLTAQFYITTRNILRFQFLHSVSAKIQFGFFRFW